MNGLITINFGGRARSFIFKTKAIGEIIAHFGMSITELGFLIDNNPWKFFPVAFYYGLATGSEKAKEVIDYTVDDVYDWVDEKGGLSNEEIKKVTETFLVSIGAKLPADPEAEPATEAEAEKK